MKHVTAFLMTLFLLFSCTACGGEDTLIGTWEGPLEVSVLGESVQEPGTTTETIRFTFSEDGTGSMEITSDLILAEMPYQSFQYTPDAEQLTLTLDNGQTMEFTYHLDGDTLSLDGRADLTLTRTE